MCSASLVGPYLLQYNGGQRDAAGLSLFPVWSFLRYNAPRR
jgi:hypothetical protein